MTDAHASLVGALRRIEAMDESEGAHIAFSRAKRVARDALRENAHASLWTFLRRKRSEHFALPLSEQFRREWIAFFVVAAIVYAVAILLAVTA